MRRPTLPLGPMMLIWLTATPALAQDVTRPRPYPVFESPAFAGAVANGTRTRTGQPGPGYWTNYAQYRIRAELDPATRMLEGTAQIRYENRSPQPTAGVILHVRQNLFREEAVRNRVVPITGGMTITRVAVGSTTLMPLAGPGAGPGYAVDGTLLLVRLPEPLAAGASTELVIDWSFVVTPNGAPRGGTDNEVYFLSYWYPQVAVWDDVDGWHTDNYMGNAEFYMGYGDYDVELTLPAGWLIGATGTLQNAEQVLSQRTRDRLARARYTRETIHIVTADERGAGGATLAGTDGKLTWRFRATNVRDFAWGASDRYLWDATTAIAGDIDADGAADTTEIHTFYRPERVAWAWARSAEFVQHSIDFLSRYLWPYPWPHMTAVDGVTSCSGMEYPMMTCIGGQRDTTSLYSVLVHETAHMWFPMMVGSNEKGHSWQDEGLTRFNQNQAMREFFGMDREGPVRQNYLNFARTGGELELMRHGDQYPVGTPAFGIASYDKMATLLVALRAVLGEETFLRAYREYGRRWLYAHPTPWDLFNTFEDVAGEDLDWFWTPWFFETWTLDQAIQEVVIDGAEARIVIEDQGLAPMPAFVVVTREDGRTERITVSPAVWLEGERQHTLRIPSSPRIVSIEIDPEQSLPDIDRSDNRWVSTRD